MVLEATVIVIDNSEWMRNSDFTPTRLEAQNDAVNFLFNAKTQSNRENDVGLVTMAGKSPQVMVTLTSEIGKILTALHETKIGGKIQFSTSIQIAQLVLKHRQNKNQKQRIIVFVSSPIEETEEELVKLGKKLKKNSVSVDVIDFGCEGQSHKLEAFVNALNSNNLSQHLVVPPGPHILSDMLVPLVSGEDGGLQLNEFGIDPNLDPELALALKMSMEEEAARIEREKQKAAGQ